jgi:hypothetical protein
MKNIVLLVFVIATPLFTNAQCHHFSGSHVHFSGHAGGFHYHPSHSYHYHSRYNHNTRVPNPVEPMKNVSEIDGGAGFLPAIQATDPTSSNATPVYLASYKYFLTDRFAIGVTGGFQTLSGKDTCNCTTPQGTTTAQYNYKANNFVLAANFTWVYSNWHEVETYGELSGGISIIKEHDNYGGEAASSATFNKAAFQATPLGIRVGGNFGGFIEFGYGYKGIISGGLSYQMGRKSYSNSIGKIKPHKPIS